MAGSRDPLGAMLRAYLVKADRIPEATVLGWDRKVSCSNAALANGALAHVLDFDDTSYSTCGHPTAPIMPAVLSVGEVNQLSGKQILEAFVLGFEAQCKLGAAINPHFLDRGWHPMGPLGRVGSVIAVSKLLGFDQEKMENALGLACATASGICAVMGSSAKAMNSGFAAEAGVRSAFLAHQGLTGPKGVLERKGGFCDMFAGEYALSRLTDNLGNPYDLICPSVDFKQYPSCSATQAAIDAMLRIREETGLRPDEVEAIECRAGPWIPRLLVHPFPKNGLEGKFSMPYCLSVALLHGAVRIEDFENGAVTDTKVTKLLKKVTVIPDMTLEKEGHVEGAIVTVRDIHGRRFERRVDKAKGSSENPLSDSELLQKFTMVTSKCFEAKTAAKLGDLIMNLERVESIAELTSYSAS